MKKTPMSTVFGVIVALSLTTAWRVDAQAPALVNYTQGRAYTFNSAGNSYLVQNNFKLTTTIKANFAKFDSSTAIGIKIGELDVLQNLYDGKALVSISSIDDAVTNSANNSAAVKARIFPEKGTGTLQGFIVKTSTYVDPDTEETQTVKTALGTVKISWSKSKMSVSVVFGENRKIAAPSILAVLPVELPTPTQWQPKFNLSLPVTVTFGAATFTQSDLHFVGTASFTPTGMMNRVSGKMTGYLQRSSN